MATTRVMQLVLGTIEEFVNNLPQDEFVCRVCKKPVGDSRENCYIALYRKGTCLMFCEPHAMHYIDAEREAYKLEHKTYTCASCQKSGLSSREPVYIHVDAMGTCTPRCVPCGDARGTTYYHFTNVGPDVEE